MKARAVTAVVASLRAAIEDRNKPLTKAVDARFERRFAALRAAEEKLRAAYDSALTTSGVIDYTARCRVLKAAELDLLLADSDFDLNEWLTAKLKALS